jgi:hypothetical protein
MTAGRFSTIAPDLTTPYRFTLAEMDVRCDHSDLPRPSCWHCRPDVLMRLAADPVFAAWLDRVAENPDA